MTTATVSSVLEANLERVFNERDVARRHKAIREIYADDAVLYEPNATHRGAEAITRAVTDLLGTPPSLVFSMVAPVLVNHDMGKLLWRGHLPNGTTVVTGTDVVQVEGGRIRTIHVFVDPTK